MSGQQPADGVPERRALEPQRQRQVAAGQHPLLDLAGSLAHVAADLSEARVGGVIDQRPGRLVHPRFSGLNFVRHFRNP